MCPPAAACPGCCPDADALAGNSVKYATGKAASKVSRVFYWLTISQRLINAVVTTNRCSDGQQIGIGRFVVIPVKYGVP